MTQPATAPGPRPLWRSTVGAAVVTGASLWLTWSSQQLPTMCPAIYPAPASCSLDAPFSPAGWGTVVIVSLFSALLAASAVIGSERKLIVLRCLMASLGVAAIVVPLWTLGVSGLSA
ncbi:hypothetical protein SAMN04489740_1124 [Arthrobacter alpinus]|uniref:Vitamin K epoxide reductase domain-containing protein n=1 Tax=Arthrobacter alpinus TaxID=656366 RepID=A0A1H5HWX7_9MICC|nr:hypothetical protein [Arthrobacter alpinus]SEE32161.1 hypothetical protein SAMN04489740_1124 [Arthrobacter alpinus]